MRERNVNWQPKSKKALSTTQQAEYKGNELLQHEAIELQENNIIMDPYYKALSLFRARKYEQCIEMCNQLLANSPQLQGPWELKMRAMTQRVYIDDIEAEDDGVVGILTIFFLYSYHHSFDRNSMQQQQFLC